MNWQPIETAPKDRRVLLWFPTLFGTGCWSGGEWISEENHRKPLPHFTCDLIRLIGLVAIRDCQPTHWMEIAPPE